jgi:hypothetical protein
MSWRMLVGLMVGLLAVPVAAAPALAPAVRAEVPGAELVGEARLRKYLVHVYDAALWAPGGRYRADGPFVLDIRYARTIRASQINERTLAEWDRRGLLAGPHGAALRVALEDAWPDVGPGDHLTAVSRPGAPVRLYFNGRLYKEIEQPAFGPAFFAIWLDADSSEPALQRALLGGS